MIDLSRCDGDLASAAKALLAVAGNIDARVAQCLKKRTVGRHRDREAGIGEIDLERPVALRIGRGGTGMEVLDLERALGPAFGDHVQRGEQPLRSAGIDPGGGNGNRLPQFRKVEAPSLVSGIDPQRRAMVRLDAIQEGHGRARAPA